jgi:DNA modification methylase
METNKIYQGNSLEVLKTFPDESIQTCITSPPYYGLRDYGVEGQFGLETDVEDYVQSLVDLFREVKRVLKDDGTVWLNLGDTYWGGGWRNDMIREQSGDIQQGHKGTHDAKQITNATGKHPIYKPKDLMGVPWKVAFALQEDGWYLRQDIIWHKPNPMPESVTDRCTKNHEYIFLLSKSRTYYFDHESIKEPASYDGRKDTKVKRSPKYEGQMIVPGSTNESYHARPHERWKENEDGVKVRNKRSVWTVNKRPFAEAHFATFPEDLIEPCILAGSPEEGVVLDTFSGAGTTAVVATKHNRNYVGIELNPEYIEISEKRLEPVKEKQKQLNHNKEIVSKYFG